MNAAPVRRPDSATGLSAVSWPLVLALATVALARPLLSITGLANDWGRPGTPVLEGELRGPLTFPPALAANAVSGLVTGLLARALLRRTDPRSP